MKRILYLTLSISLIITFSNISIYALDKTEHSKNLNGCTYLQKTSIVMESINSKGNKIIIFEDGVEVEYFDNNTAIDYVAGLFQSDGTYTYKVSGNYIPGCEPSRSLPCNSGYYEYRVEKVA